MKILSWNVNGIRAVYKKNFLNWFRKSQADIVCLQEIKAQKNQIPPDLLSPPHYFVYVNPARRKGYAGALIYTKQKPNEMNTKMGLERFDKEGRILELYYPNLILINLYLPHGGRQKENLDYKLKVYEYLLQRLKRFKNKKVILIGDFNIAHQEIDLARPKDNQNNVMFTAEERKQIDKIITLGFIDTFRKFYPHSSGHYTWWPYFYNARNRNLGWRIDYIFVSKPLALHLKKAFILPKVMGSDHCPIGIEI